MTTCMAVDCKSKTRHGRAKFLQTSKGRKAETAMAHKNKT